MRRRKLIVGASVLVLLPLLFLVEEHFRGKWALERWKATMRAKGEKFEVERLIPSPPDNADNGLPQLVWAAGQLAASPDLTMMAPPLLHFVAPGKVLFSPGQSEWRVRWFSGKN